MRSGHISLKCFQAVRKLLLYPLERFEWKIIGAEQNVTLRFPTLYFHRVLVKLIATSRYANEFKARRTGDAIPCQ